MQRVLTFPTSRGSDSREFISKRMCFAFMFSLGFLAFLGGFLLGRFVFDKELELSRIKYKEHCNKGNQGEVVGVKEKFRATSIVDSIKETSIEDYIRLLTSQQDRNSSSKNFLEASVFQKHLQENGFDYVSPLVETTTELSFPSTTGPNKAEIVDGEGTTILQCNDIRERHSGPDDGIMSGVAEGAIVYANIGAQADYHHLDLLRVPCKGNIVLIRGGHIPFADIVTNAAERDVGGILLFVDPERKDIQQPLIPPAELAKLNRNIKKWAKGIPVLELSTKDVIKIFDKMRPASPPRNWTGKLETLYSIGPGFVERNWRMKITFNTVNIVKDSYNVLGAIRGSNEPDRFVMITNEKGLTHSEERPLSILMELIRVLGDRKSNGWRPQRSIIIAFWGLEGPDLHLSSQPDNVIQHMARKTVAYFKINAFVEAANATLAKVTPILENLFYESAQSVPLQKASADITPSLSGENPLIGFGVPFLSVNHFNTKTIKDVASFWAEAIWQTVENSKLPFSLAGYAKLFSHSIDVIEKKFDKIAKSHSVSLDSFYQSVNNLVDVIKTHEEKWAQGYSPLDMRIMSDQMLDFNSFLLYDGDPGSGNYQRSDRTVLSKPETGYDEETAFGELQDYLEDLSTMRKNNTDFKKRIISHLASLVETINLARNALTDGLESFIAGNA